VAAGRQEVQLVAVVPVAPGHDHKHSDERRAESEYRTSGERREVPITGAVRYLPERGRHSPKYTVGQLNAAGCHSMPSAAASKHPSRLIWTGLA
jgi:hypothetical protein